MKKNWNTMTMEEKNSNFQRIEVDFDKMRVYAYGFGYVNQRDADVEEAMQEELDSKRPNRYEVQDAQYFEEEDCWSAKFVEIPIETMSELCEYINNSEDWPSDVEAIIEQNGWVSDTGVDTGICHNADEICYLNEDGKAVTATGKGIANIEVSKSGMGYDLTYTVYGKPVCVTGEFFIDKNGYLHHEDATTGEEIKVKVLEGGKANYYIVMVVDGKYRYVATTDDIDNDGFVDADPDNFSFPTIEEAEKTKTFFENYAKHRGYNVRFTIEAVEE